MRNDKDNLIVPLPFVFALVIINFTEAIKQTNCIEMTSQIFRSGTSKGSTIREAQSDESKANFIHKFKIAAKRS